MTTQLEDAGLMNHVTIIEDEADIAGLLAHCFACEGFQVTTARDGNAGLEIIHRRSEPRQTLGSRRGRLHRETV